MAAAGSHTAPPRQRWLPAGPIAVNSEAIFCGSLRFSAVLCGSLRFAAVRCGSLRIYELKASIENAQRAADDDGKPHGAVNGLVIIRGRREMALTPRSTRQQLMEFDWRRCG